MKFIYTIIFLFISSVLFAQITFVSDNFIYPAGDELTDHGWYAHSAVATNPILVSDGGLNWATYIGSGLGNAALVTNTGQDINKPFSQNATSNAVYASFLMKVNNSFSQDGEGVFLHYGYYTNNTTPNADFSNVATAFRARTHIAQGTDVSTEFKLGLSFNTGDPTDITSDLNIGETYLVVIKYLFVDGEDNDSVSLYVFTEGDDISSEPATPNLGPFAGSASDAPALQTIALRQYDENQDVTVDGIYVKDSWDIETCEFATSTDTKTECAGFTWINGETYIENNNAATFTIEDGAANGCDSIITLNLTIIEVNSEISVTDNTITSSSSTGIYQWLDCEEGNIEISGATEQSFTPSFSGNYALEITENGCTEISECVDVTLVSIADIAFSNSLNIYPNPSNGPVLISWNEPQEVTISVFNTLGQKIEEIPSFFGTSAEIKLLNNKGLFLVEILNANNHKISKRIIKY